MEQPNLFPVNDQLLLVIEEAPRLTMQEEKKIIAETQKLSFHYLRTVCNNVTKKSITILVHGMQHAIFSLLNYIDEKQQKDHNLFREKITTHLVEFLSFLQQHSGSHFHLDAPVPQIIWRSVRPTIESSLVSGKDFLLQGIEQTLVKVIQHVYSDTTTPTPSFRQMHYWQTIIGILKQDHLHPQQNTTRCLFTLIQYNCNHSDLIRYVFNSYLHGITETDNPHLHWNNALLHIRRIISETTWILFPHEKNCKDALVELIQGELNTLDFTTQASTLMTCKIPFAYSLSVAQLALWIRLHIESGMIECNNISELLRYYTEQATLTKTNSFVFKSLYNKYHQPDRASIQIMLAYTDRMQKILKTLLH